MQALRCAALVLAAACSDRPSPDKPPVPSGSAPVVASDAAVAAAPGQATDAAVATVSDARVWDDQEIRARDGFTVQQRDKVARLSDGAGTLELALPVPPVVDGKIVDQDGVQAFHAQALLNGKAVIDVEVSMISMLDGDLPAALLQQTSKIPEQFAAATGGKVVVNEATTVGGVASRRFELVTPDKRRLFGWYAAVSGRRFLQINCIGADLAGIRTACEAIPKSVTLAK